MTTETKNSLVGQAIEIMLTGKVKNANPSFASCNCSVCNQGIYDDEAGEAPPYSWSEPAVEMTWDWLVSNWEELGELKCDRRGYEFDGGSCETRGHEPWICDKCASIEGNFVRGLAVSLSYFNIHPEILKHIWEAGPESIYLIVGVGYRKTGQWYKVMEQGDVILYAMTDEEGLYEGLAEAVYDFILMDPEQTLDYGHWGFQLDKAEEYCKEVLGEDDTEAFLNRIHNCETFSREYEQINGGSGYLDNDYITWRAL